MKQENVNRADPFVVTDARGEITDITIYVDEPNYGEIEVSLEFSNLSVCKSHEKVWGAPMVEKGSPWHCHHSEPHFHGGVLCMTKGLNCRPCQPVEPLPLEERIECVVEALRRFAKEFGGGVKVEGTDGK